VAGTALDFREPAFVGERLGGGGFDGAEVGSEGRSDERRDGFAFETQHLSDSPNHANFPSTRLRSGATHRVMHL